MKVIQLHRQGIKAPELIDTYFNAIYQICVNTTGKDWPTIHKYIIDNNLHVVLHYIFDDGTVETECYEPSTSIIDNKEWAIEKTRLPLYSKYNGRSIDKIDEIFTEELSHIDMTLYIKFARP